MAIPGSSDGQEVLRRGSMNNQSNDHTSFDFTGALPTVGDETDTVPANHIITMLSIIWNDQSTGAEEIRLYTVNGGNNHYILFDQPLASSGTYIYSERIVIIGGDALKTGMQSSTSCDIWYSYLDQDWS